MLGQVGYSELNHHTDKRATLNSWCDSVCITTQQLGGWVAEAQDGETHESAAAALHHDTCDQ
jgi:hypothetical protein